MIVKPIIYTVLKVATFLLYILTILSAFGGYINPAIWAIPSIATLLLPYFGMATALATLFWLISRRFITGALGVLTILLCITPLSQALPVSFSKQPLPGEKTFSMVSFNCTHFSDLRQPDHVPNRSMEYLLETDADFICLAELYALDPDGKIGKEGGVREKLLERYPYRSKDPWRDVELFSKYPFTTLDVKIPTHLQFYSFGVYRIDLKGSPMTVVVVHLPSYILSQQERDIITNARNINGAKASLKEFKGTILSKMSQAFKTRALVSEAIVEMLQDEKGPLIVCGDFNDVPASWTYRTFINAGFHDAYAETSFGHLITFNTHMMFFHIDQILYRGDLRPLYVKKNSMDASDHYPLMAEFAFTGK